MSGYVQKRPTSRAFNHFEPRPVKLLVGPINPPVEYTKAGTPCKRQPEPYRPGDTCWAKLRYDGNVNIFPFEMAGSGYEIVVDAEEGVHYEFV
jgi:hypothetical protein